MIRTLFGLTLLSLLSGGGCLFGCSAKTAGSGEIFLEFGTKIAVGADTQKRDDTQVLETEIKFSGNLLGLADAEATAETPGP